MAGMEGGATLVFSTADWNISEASASLSMSGLDLSESGERTVGGQLEDSGREISRFLPRHLGTLVRSGEDSSRGAALTDCGGSHQYQGDPLGHHRPGSQQAEEDEDGGQDVTEGEFEGDVESVGERGGGEDTHRLLGTQSHGGADGELRQGGEEGEEDEGEEQEATLLQSGQHPGGSLHQQQADQADDHVVGQRLPAVQ